MSGKPFESILIPYRDEIFALRRNKPPVSYARIAEILCEKYGLTIQRAGISKFVKVRAKKYKSCKYAWTNEPATAKNITTVDKPPLQKTTALQTPKPSVPNKSTTPVELRPEEVFEMPFSETYSIDLLPPEEAAAWLKQIKERNKQ